MITAAIVAALIVALRKLVQRILFLIGEGLCWVVGFLTDIFEVVAGLKSVTYKADGFTEEKLLLRVFFGNTNVNTIYWGMALIGIVMCVGFTIAAVIKKSADSGDKMKQSMGDILKNCFKGITLILLMNFIISATISITSVLMDRINYLITNAQNIDMSYDVTFDTDDYATMARCLDNIGNFSLNASYNSRYNLNDCYNTIRPDLQHLAEKGKFDITYVTTVYNEDGTSRTANTWQSVLQNIYRSVDDITVDQPLDQYNDKLSEAILSAMSVIKNDASFEALEKYHVTQTGQAVGEMVSLDRMIMLIGSMYSSSMKAGSGFTDYLRAPYYYGQKDIFDYDVCDDDFDMDLGSWLYLTVIIVAYLFIKEMLTMVFNATARIFNMMLLYISAPPFIAVTPLDDGGKLKQWTTAFVIQSFGLFGTVIALRLVMIFIPMLFSGDIQFFSNARSDIFARVIIMYGAIFTARKASGMIVGILADNAGMQAISAGDLGSEATNAIGSSIGAAKTIGGKMFAHDMWMNRERKQNARDKASQGGGKGGEKGGKDAKNTPANKLDMGGKKPSGSSPSNKNGLGAVGPGNDKKPGGPGDNKQPPSNKGPLGGNQGGPLGGNQGGPLGGNQGGGPSGGNQGDPFGDPGNNRTPSSHSSFGDPGNPGGGEGGDNPSNKKIPRSSMEKFK